jgi:peptidoglycan/LPS O-acetylase OafA/YrhL
MAEYPVLPSGRTRILLVAAFFYVLSIRWILVFSLSLAGPYAKISISTLVWGLAIGAATFYLLKGSVFAKWFLVAVSIVSMLTAIAILLVADELSDRLLGMFFGVGGAGSLYLLTLSTKLHSEFERRRAEHEAGRRAAGQSE